MSELLEILSLQEKCTPEEQIKEKYISQLTKKINKCLSIPNDELFAALFFYDNIYARKHPLSKVQEIADRLWNEWMKRGYIYEDYECQFLRTVYLLNTKLIHSDQASPKEKAEQRYKGDDPVLSYEFRDLLFNSIHHKTFRTILSSVSTFIASSSTYSGLVELMMWLDMYATFNQRFSYEQHQLKEQMDLIQPWILDENYKKYLSSYSSKINIVKKFYIGTCSLFCSSLYKYGGYREPYRWSKLVESLLFYFQSYIIESAQFITQWTDDHLYCAVGIMNIITNYYCQVNKNENYPSLQPNLFRQYKQFHESLIKILEQEQFRQRILSTRTNYETHLIDLIMKYVLTVLNAYNNIKYILRFMNTFPIFAKFLETEHTEINLNALYLCSKICIDDDIRKLNIAEKLTSIYLRSIEDLTATYLQLNEDVKKQYSKSSTPTTRQRTYIETRLNTHLDYFSLLATNTSIQEAIGIRNDLKYFVDYPEKEKFQQIFHILWSLSFHPLIQKQFRHDERLSTTIRKCQKEKNNIISIILWTLGDHVGIANTALAREEHDHKNFPMNFYVNKWEEIFPYKVILNYSSYDHDIGEKISDHLRINGFRPLCKLSISLLQSNKLDSLQNMIICLSESYEQSNFDRAILQFSTKKQFNIIPIIIEKYYKPQGWIKEIFSQTQIIDLTQLTFIDSINTLIDILQNKIKIKSEVSSAEMTIDNIDQSEKISQDLFKACKRNDVRKLRKYLKTLTIDQINRIGLDGNTALHIATNCNHKEIIELLLNNEISRSIRNSITNLTAYEEASTLEIKQLFQRINDVNRFVAESSPEFFEWTLHYDDPSLQRSQFRRQLQNPFKVDRNDVRTTLKDYQLSIIFREILEKFSENFFTPLSSTEISSRHKSFIDWFLQQAIEKANSIYILKAYTSTTSFYRILNKTLAQFALGYFDAILQESTDYKVVASIISLISLLIYDPDMDKYDYRGKTYRGMLFTEKDLMKYVVGSKLMNISFVSTSKTRDVAEIFADECTQSSFSPTSNKNLINIPTICIYTIKNMGTALDIEKISEIPDEREVLLLPFSAFQIRCLRRLDKTVKKGIAIELELEECDEYQGKESQIHKQRQLLQSLLQQHGEFSNNIDNRISD